jgi:hypothetical protein
LSKIAAQRVPHFAERFIPRFAEHAFEFRLEIGDDALNLFHQPPAARGETNEFRAPIVGMHIDTHQV